MYTMYVFSLLLVLIVTI